MADWLYEGVHFVECHGPGEDDQPVTLSPAWIDDEGVEHPATVLTDPPEWVQQMPEMTEVADGS